MKNKKSSLKDRMESEGLGSIESIEGIEKPKYTEVYVERPSDKKNKKD